MKTNYLFLISLIWGLGFYSCSSDDIIDSPQVEPEAKMQVVTYDFPEFSSSLKSIIGASLSNYSLTYCVYQRGGDKDAHFVKEKNFSKGEVTSINDTLPVGKYYVSVIASTAESLRIHSQLLHLNNYLGTTGVIHLTGFKDDLLYDTFELEVSNEPVQKNISLERIVSKIEIIIEDVASMPDNLLGLSIESANNKIPTDFLLNDKQTQFTPQQMILINIPKEEVLKINDNNPLWFYVFPTNKSDGGNDFDLLLSAVYGDTFDHVVGDQKKVIKKNIKLDANQTLRLKGKFFGNSVNNAIEVNDVWGTSFEESF